jgi:hypothetical protein
MIGEIYDALRSAGVDEAKARLAAEAMETYDPRLGRSESELVLMRCMLGVNIALSVAILGRLLFMH